MSDPSIVETIAEFAGKYAVVQSAMAAGVFIWLWTKVIKPGEKEMPTDEEMKAKWQAQQDLSDISENVKLLVTFSKETRDALNRLASIQWNRGQTGP